VGGEYVPAAQSIHTTGNEDQTALQPVVVRLESEVHQKRRIPVEEVKERGIKLPDAFKSL
jgi:hypothetical protein